MRLLQVSWLETSSQGPVTMLAALLPQIKHSPETVMFIPVT